MIPARVAIALQDAGWYLRSDIIYNKKNPMPESVTDRPSNCYEHIFLLAKNARYFYDSEAVREKAQDWGTRDRSNLRGGTDDPHLKHSGLTNGNSAESGRNQRNVWTMSTRAFSEAHFATFPEELPRRCIFAGTSERGCCPECGAPWKRIVDRKTNYGRREPAHAPMSTASKVDSSEWKPPTITELGWEPTCNQGLEPVPCVMLDPFSGSGTTGLVALRYGRRYIGIDLNAEYLDMSIRRLAGVVGQNTLDLSVV